MPLAVVPKHDALAAVAMRHEQIECSIVIEVRRYDGRRRFCRERFACGKAALAVVEAKETRSGDVGAFTGFSVYQVRIVAAVGGHYVWMAVSVEVRQGHVPCAPLGIAERAEFSEVALTVIQVDKFAIRRIVADHDVQVAVDIGQRRRIDAVGRRPQVTGDEAAMAIVQEHPIEERPMPPFAKDDVQQTVSVEIAHAYAG